MRKEASISRFLTVLLLRPHLLGLPKTMDLATSTSGRRFLPHPWRRPYCIVRSPLSPLREEIQNSILLLAARSSHYP